MKAILTLTAGPLGGMETFSSHLCETFPDLKIIDFSQASQSLLAKIPFPFATMPHKGMVICRHFMRMQKQLKADAVFTSGLYGWYLALRGIDIPIINTLHGVAKSFAMDSYKKTTFDYYRMKYIYSLAERISAKRSVSVCNSNFTRELIKKHYNVESKVIFNAVDTRIFRPIPKPESREILKLPDRTTGIFVGPPAYSKGFDIIQKLASIHRDIDFLCISPKNASSGQKNLKIISGVDHSQLYKYYSAADFCIFPSRFEGFGYVPLEALACNTPVIARKTGILTEFSPPGSFLIDNSSVNDYSKAIFEFVNNLKYPKTHVLIKENFSLERFSREYKNLVKNLW